MNRKLFVFLSLILVASMLLAACGQIAQPTVEAPVEATEVAPDEEPTEEAATEVVPTEEPTEPPVARTDRKGGWLDEVVFTVADPAAVVTQIKAGDIDIYAEGLSPAFATEVFESGLAYAQNQGTYYDILFNPAVMNDGSFNPFGNKKIREAFNWLIDRNYFVQEIFHGGGKAKFFPIVTEWPDYADLADTVRKLESYYAYDPEKAKEVITTEMEDMGAELVDGKWTYEGNPVKLIFIIRNDAARTAMGDWIADRLEELGFEIDRQYKSGSEASPIWIGSDPKEGQWHLYTAGWGASVINRDEGGIFQEMFLPTSQQGIPVWSENTPDPEFQQLGDDLYNAKYSTLEERRGMMSRALELSMQDAFQLFLVDSAEFTPYRTDLVAVADLAAGVQGAQVAKYTLRYEGVEGGSVKWAQQDLFAEPYNPIAGTNWTFDQAVVNFTETGGVIYDPYTGLVHPDRLESAEITIQTGLPVAKSLDWVSLDFADEIVVPDDAWVDWDAEAQTFVTAADAGLSGATAKRKSVAIYPADVFEVNKWHDGSNVELADLIMSWILTFDRADEKSAIYDPAAVPQFEVFKAGFKGLKIASTDPLTIEYYSDVYSTDAELNVFSMWPTWTTGELSFTMAAAANAAEEAKELAYTTEKSTENECEWTSFIGGPSLEILAAKLDELIANQTVPYEATLGQYMTPEQAVARYESLKAFYEAKGHMWTGTGPYFVDQVYMTEKSLVVKHNPDFPDPADRWDVFATPRIAEAEIDGPGQVKVGEAAEFDVFVTFNDEPYVAGDVKQVKFLLYNATNELVVIGEAEMVEDGHYVVKLSEEDTASLDAGSNKLEIAVIPIPVCQPTFTSVEFVTVQ